MNDANTTSPRTRLAALLPFLLIAMLVVGNAILCNLLVVPEWRASDALMAQLETDQTAVADQLAQQDQETLGVLQQQIKSAEANLNEAASGFLTEDQADALLQSLYGYAHASDVRITRLQAQQTGQQPQKQPNRKSNQKAQTNQVTGAYGVRVFQVEVNGPIPQLMNFIARIQEASIPSISLANLNITSGNAEDTLTMDVTVYLSPYASGQALADLPPVNLPVPVATTMPAETPQVIEAASDTVLEGSTSGESTSATSSTDSACPGAPESIFKIGDTVVVDFNTTGSLNVLRLPRQGGDADVLALAYDNHRMLLLDGPVCGQWEGQNLWYWSVAYAGVTGWVGEASVEDRWLCPLSDPECA